MGSPGALKWQTYPQSEPDKFESYLVVDVVNDEEIYYVGTPYLDVSKHTKWSIAGNKDPYLDSTQKWVEISELKKIIK